MLGNSLSKIMQVNPIQRQSIVSFISAIGLTLMGLFSTMYFSHAVGPAILGTYFLFLAYLGIFSLISDAGLGSAAVQRIAEGKEQSKYFTAFLFLTANLLLTTAVALVAVQIFIIDFVGLGIFFWLLAALLVGAIYVAVNSGNVGTGKVGISQTAAFVNNTVKIVVQVVAVFLGFGTGGLIGGYLCGLLVGLLLNLRFFELRLARFEKRHIQRLFAFSFWIFLSSSGILVYNYTDTILIGYYMTEADIGIYRVAFQFTSIASLVAIAFVNSLYPRVSMWGTEQEIHSVESALSRAFTYSLLLALPILAGGWILGDRLLYFFYGEAFATGAPAMVILLATQVAFIFMTLQTMCLNALDRPRDSFKVTAVSAMVNVILNILLIPGFGILGAAGATFATMVLNAVLSYRLLNRIIHVYFELSAVLHIITATVVMTVAVGFVRYLMPLSHITFVIGAVILGGGLYGLTLLKLDRSIREELQAIAEKTGVPWPAFL